MQRLHACQGKPGAGSPRWAALGIKSPYMGLGPAGLQMWGGKSPPGFSTLPPSIALSPCKLTLAGTWLWHCRWGSHASCGQEQPQPLSSSISEPCSSARLSPFTPNPHTSPFCKAGQIHPSFGCKSITWTKRFVLGSCTCRTGGVSPTTCTPVTPQLG